MKKLLRIHQGSGMHWVGNGFPVRSVFDYNGLGRELSPFLLLDYAAPYQFPPGNEKRGVGGHPHKGLFKNKFRFCWRLFGCLARRERRAYPPAVCKERATTPDSQTAPALRGGAAPGHLLRCSSVTAHWRGCSWCPCGSTSRLASGQAALPPKSEVIFEQTLSATAIRRVCCHRQWVGMLLNAALPCTSHR